MNISRSTIRSVERAIELLRALNMEAISTLDSLNHQTGLPKSTLVRLLRTLEVKRLVSQSSQYGNYFLTAGINTLSCGYHHEPLIVEAAAPIMEELTKKIKWPLSVAVFDRDSMIIRYSTIPHSPWARLHSTLGMRPSMVKRAIGRVYLAHCSSEEQELILQIVRQSSHPDDDLAKDEKAVRKILSDAYRLGYALSDPAANTISPTIAVPIFDEGRVIASLGLTWFSTVMSNKQAIDQLLPELKKAGENISARLKQLREISEASISSPRALAFISEASLRSAKAQPSATNKSHAVSASDVKMIEGKYQALEGRLDEATLRLWAAVEARGLGRGGVSMVAKALGISRTTIYAGLKELKSSGSRRSAEHGLASGAAIRRVRAQGGGRKRLTEKDTALLRDLDALLEPAAQEASWLPLRWTSKSTTRLARELAEQGHRVSQRSVCDLLSHLGYSLRAPCKAREGGMQLERNAQFRHIAILAAQFYVTGDPVIAVNVMRKELTGNFKKSNGKQYFKKKPEHAEIDDFNHSESGKKAPGEFRVATAYQGWVRAAIDHDTAEFLVECIRRWWNEVGRPSFPKARRLLLASSSSCSSGRGVRLWRGQLQKLAYDLNLIIQVCHLPPGTSKWNKIEDRKVHISNNSRGHSSLSHEVTIDLIGGTATAPGGRARPQLNEESFKAGAKTPDERISNPEIECNSSEQGWKYCIFP